MLPPEYEDGFDFLNLNEDLLRGIYTYGFESCSPVQKHILIPRKPVSEPEESSSVSSLTVQNDCTISSKLVQWRSGSGKSCALNMRVLMQVDFQKDHLQGLILVPTEYLAIQTIKILLYIADYINNPRISMIVEEASSFTIENPKILVTTPQLAIEHKVDVSKLEILAIEEMDLLLEIGSEHRKYIRSIFTQLPSMKNTEILCVGRRMPSPQSYMHDEHLKDSIIIRDSQELSDTINESYVYCPKEEQKLSLLKESTLIKSYPNYAIFFNSYNRAEQMVDVLKEINPSPIKAVPHWGSLEDRYSSFRDAFPFTATEEHWYGIDIHWCTTVIHFDIVRDVVKSRLRSGVCGRFGRSGSSLYLPSTLEELDFVSELLLGSANCKYQRIMLKDLHYSDLLICC